VSKFKDDDDEPDEAQHGGADDHDLDFGVDEEDIEHAQLIPLSSQEEIEAAAAEWGAQWRSEVQPKPLPWPDLSLQSPLPALTAQVARKAAHTFPNGTGLGWESSTPRLFAAAMTRLWKRWSDCSSSSRWLAVGRR
jgi:hypothetical protein